MQATNSCGTATSNNASLAVNPQPTAPTLLSKNPNSSSIVAGTEVSATFNDGTGGTGCPDDYIVIIDGGTPAAYTPGTDVGASAATSIEIQGRRANCSAGSGCTGTSYTTLASWTVEPLPVELTSFTGNVLGSYVELNWHTATEVDNYGFEVERSQMSNIKSESWEKIGFVHGNGNSNSPKEYSLTDKNPNGGSKFIYRLKQIDNSGQFKYSKKIEVELVPNEFILYQNYPNPFNPVTNIKFALPKVTKVILSVYNSLGEKVASLFNEDKEAGYYEVKFDALQLSSGIYFYKLQAGSFAETKKMILLK